MGNNIAQLRKAKGLTQAELARRLGFARSYIHKLESSEQQPNVATSLRIADILGCTLNDLFLKKMVTYR